MKVERLNLDNDQIEQVDCIGQVQFIGQDKNADLTNGNKYYVIGIRNNLLKIIDDSKDYYYYLPFDAADIGVKEGIHSGFHILQDDTGRITELFNRYKIELKMKQEKNAKKLTHRLIEWKFKKQEQNKS